MLKPKVSDFDDGTGNIDWKEYEEVYGDYEDEQYETMRDREMFEDDNND
jgi:hypothetical protein